MIFFFYKSYLVIPKCVHTYTNHSYSVKQKIFVPEGSNNEGGANAYTDLQIAEMIDGTFGGMDKNNDGFIDFAEYRFLDNQ